MPTPPGGRPTRTARRPDELLSERHTCCTSQSPHPATDGTRRQPEEQARCPDAPAARSRRRPLDFARNVTRTAPEDTTTRKEPSLQNLRCRRAALAVSAIGRPRRHPPG